MGRYLGNNINYPKSAYQQGISGTVLLGFTVDREGNVTNVKVVRSVDQEIDDEAVAVLKRSPKWISATERGLSVTVKYEIPIRFSLQ